LRQQQSTLLFVTLVFGGFLFDLMAQIVEFRLCIAKRF
jgi:hypothetical protein